MQKFVNLARLRDANPLDTPDQLFTSYMDHLEGGFEAFVVAESGRSPHPLDHADYLAWYAGKLSRPDLPWPPVLFSSYLDQVIQPEDAENCLETFAEEPYVFHALNLLNISGGQTSEILDDDSPGEPGPENDPVIRWMMVLEIIFFRYFDEKYGLSTPGGE